MLSILRMLQMKESLWSPIKHITVELIAGMMEGSKIEKKFCITV